MRFTLKGFRPLSKRQMDILRLVRDGINVRQTGRVLKISDRTCETYAAQIREKMGGRSIHESVILALKYKIIGLWDYRGKVVIIDKTDKKYSNVYQILSMMCGYKGKIEIPGEYENSIGEINEYVASLPFNGLIAMVNGLTDGAPDTVKSFFNNAMNANWAHYETVRLTVGDLKKLMAEVPDDTPLYFNEVREDETLHVYTAYQGHLFDKVDKKYFIFQLVK